jgi:hypothetical protein
MKDSTTYRVRITELGEKADAAVLREVLSGGAAAMMVKIPDVPAPKIARWRSTLAALINRLAAAQVRAGELRICDLSKEQCEELLNMYQVAEAIRSRQLKEHSPIGLEFRATVAGMPRRMADWARWEGRLGRCKVGRGLRVRLA